MRKLAIIIAAIAVLVGCQEKDIAQSKTTYTFISTDDIVDEFKDLAYEYGYVWAEMDVVFSEYYQGQRVHVQHEENIIAEHPYIYEASPKTEYITVRIDIRFGGHAYKDDDKFSSYIANVFYLNIGEDTKIEFSKSTMSSKSEPR